jgi:hypothetical protein
MTPNPDPQPTASESIDTHETWIVQRIEEHGQLTRTQEMPRVEADKLYDNWANNAARFNDQSISLIRITHTSKVVASHTNTKFRSLAHE